MKTHSRFLAAALLAGVSASARGQSTIVDSMTLNGDYNDITQSFIAEQFTTDANNYQSAQVTLLLGNYLAADPSVYDANFTVGLYADNSGSVGSKIGNFTFQSLAADPQSGGTSPWLYSGCYDWSYTSSLTLAANTTYWIGATNPDGQGWRVSYPDTITGPGTMGANNVGMATANGPAVNVSGVVATPEPGTLALASLGLAGVVVSRRRR